MNGIALNPVKVNSPTQYSDRQFQYFDAETRYFTEQVARYSSDFVTAQVQGLNENDPYAWGTYRIRLANVVRPSSAIQRRFDDYKYVLFESRRIEYIRPGAKFNTMGNIWLTVNPDNMSGASGQTMIRRCNAVWNHLDFYGNVVSEPIIAENERANASDSDAQSSQLISKGYFNVICQYNDDTRQIDTNTRMILGTAAYRVTGYSDFETEFTGDYSTVRLLSFSVRYEEPNDAIDDMVNHVAGGKTFTWDIAISGRNTLKVGESAQFTAISSRNNEIATSTEENPISYEWESSDESVITVDNNGYAEAVGDGSATIRVKLAQNPLIHENINITVSASADGVDFTSTVPNTLSAYESITFTAAYFSDGVETNTPLVWTFTGANKASYAFTVAQNGKSATITCYGYSDNPLHVNASYGNYTADASITLEGI